MVFYVQETVRRRGWLASGGNATEIRFEGADNGLVVRRGQLMRALRFINAGHNPPRMIRAAGEANALDPVGSILGVLPGLELGEQSVTLAPGDVLIAYTDGVSEAMNLADEDLGEDRIVEVATPRRQG